MKKVLIVIDMQNDFVTGSLGTPEAQAIIPKVRAKIEEFMETNDTVFYTQDTHYDDYFETLEGKYLPIKHCIKDTTGWDFIPEISEFANGVRILRKESFGLGVWRTNLRILLGHYDDYQFELIGLCTDICVISNALILRAQFPNSEIIVHADCCAGTTPEKHKVALEVMMNCQIIVEGEE